MLEGSLKGFERALKGFVEEGMVRVGVAGGRVGGGELHGVSQRPRGAPWKAGLGVKLPRNCN